MDTLGAPWEAKMQSPERLLLSGAERSTLATLASHFHVSIFPT